jgi:hypothetical protein
VGDECRGGMVVHCSAHLHGHRLLEKWRQQQV